MALKRARKERIKGITPPASLSDLPVGASHWLNPNGSKKAKERSDAVPRGQRPQTQSREKGGERVWRTHGDDTASSLSCDPNPGLMLALQCLLREAQTEQLPQPRVQLTKAKPTIGTGAVSVRAIPDKHQ